MTSKSKFMRAINWILNILIVIFLIGILFMVLWRVFGDSPSDFQIILWIVGAVFTLTFKISVIMINLFSLMYKLNREVGELKIGVKTGFGKIKDDVKEIKNNLKSQKIK